MYIDIHNSLNICQLQLVQQQRNLTRNLACYAFSPKFETVAEQYPNRKEKGFQSTFVSTLICPKVEDTHPVIRCSSEVTSF